MYMEFSGKSAILYTDNKEYVRKFTVSSEIVNAQVSGNGMNATVALTMKNGKTSLYKADGSLIRR